jgi:hypothetical protein
MTSPDLQGLVKIGATAGEIWELPKRVESYKYRYSLSEVNIALSIYVRYPAEKEREIGRYLDSKRVVGVGKSNEWYKISIYNAKKVINKFFGIFILNIFVHFNIYQINWNDYSAKLIYNGVISSSCEFQQP